MKKKLFRSFIIPLVFALIGYLILISYPYFFSKINLFDSLGALSVVDEKQINLSKSQHLSGNKITTSIESTENNLGIVLIKFAPQSQKMADVIVFRIKEMGDDNWYSENSYNTDQFWQDEYFAFGFPSVADSKDKIYVLEIETLMEKGVGRISISSEQPHVAFVHSFSISQLREYNALNSYTVKKLAYVVRNIDFFENPKLLASFIFLFLLFVYRVFIVSWIKKYFLYFKKNKKKYKKSTKKIVSNFNTFSKLAIISTIAIFLSARKLTYSFFKKLHEWLISTKIYFLIFNTNIKKRVVITLLFFLFAFVYRFSASLAGGDILFYAGLGGQGDYDQFIRAATCAFRYFCPAILGQNFLIESTVLGMFYEIFGFAGGLRAYLYLMLILSSIVAVIPYILLSRKNFLTIGGIIGSLFMATSDYLTHMSINLPPDNGSLFTFSMFFIVYILAINIGTIKWLLFFGLMGTFDGLNKLIILINDLAVFMLFVPVFLYEKAKKINKLPFVRLNSKLILYSIVPLLVFFLIYSVWEYIVELNFSKPYYLRSLIEGGSMYASSNNAGSLSINESTSHSSLLEKLYYYAGLCIAMLRRIVIVAQLNSIFLTPIIIGLLFCSFLKQKFRIINAISILVFAITAFIILELFRENFLGIHDVGQYVYAWSDVTYVNIFLISGIFFLFILNFRFLALKLALPIIPYFLMLIVLAKNAPEHRMMAHVILWTIILLSFLADWILGNARKNFVLKKVWIGPVILVLFIVFYAIPKTSYMLAEFRSGLYSNMNEVKYLRWVNSELPKEAIILLGGKSNLVTVAQTINKPIIYNSLWVEAMLIKSNEIPKVKPRDFTILNDLEIYDIPGVPISDFSIIRELKKKENFEKKKYIILEKDIDMWRGRIAGIADNVFATSSRSTNLHSDDYSINVYKYNKYLNKGIYELKLKKTNKN
jgi:hypothetical protein